MRFSMSVCAVISMFTMANVAQAEDETRWGAKLGGGNKDWSFVEATMTTPVWEDTDSVLNFDLHAMNHLEAANRKSNEVSLGFIFRKKFSGKEGFWGVNTSYSFYKSWDGNDRKTPHIGFEYVGAKYSFKLNHMFQDKTRYTYDSPQQAHSYYGSDILAVEESFTGGTEALLSYHPSDRLSLGVGVYDRHGEPNHTAATLFHSETSTTIIRPVVQRHLLQSGYFFEGSYFIPGSGSGGYTLGFQVKNDKRNNGLFMLTFEYSFGGSGPSSSSSRIEREYRNAVYKADPDDFGLIAAIVAAAVDIGAEAIVDVGVDAAIDAAVDAGADAAADASADAAADSGTIINLPGMTITPTQMRVIVLS